MYWVTDVPWIERGSRPCLNLPLYMQPDYEDRGWGGSLDPQDPLWIYHCLLFVKDFVIIIIIIRDIIVLLSPSL